MHTTRIARQLQDHRDEVGEDVQFVMRCQDGVYGPLAAEVALDVIARETVEGDEPSPTELADAILAEVRQTEQDALPTAT